MSFKRVFEANQFRSRGYVGTLFRRGERTKDVVPLWAWIRMTVVELLVGDELLESLVTTASDSGCPEDPDVKGKFGRGQHLSHHIPYGLVNKLLRPRLLEVLYYKYHLQYLLLDSVAPVAESRTENIIDVTRTRFRLHKDLLGELIAFRRVYVVCWTCFNLLVDAVVFLVWQEFEAVVLSALSIEAIRRMLKL